MYNALIMKILDTVQNLLENVSRFRFSELLLVDNLIKELASFSTSRARVGKKLTPVGEDIGDVYMC